MNLHSRSSFKTAISLCVFSMGVSFVFAPFIPAKGLGLQGEMRSQSGIGVEIRTSGESNPIRLGSPGGGRGMTLILRQSLKITDSDAAGEFTALDVRSEAEGDAIKVTLSLIYNDLSNQEWWKDKKEKFAGSYLIREGEIVRPVELAQFGIEPFEIKAIDTRPVKIKPGEGPRITNSASLRVDRIEKHMDTYVVWLKNISEKNIVAYAISSGGSSVQTGSASHGGNTPVLLAGATSTEARFSGPEADRSGIEIPFVMFEDGSFEGDSKSAMRFLALAQGVKIQAPSVLKMIEQTLKVDDSDLRAAFVTLESELWVIPEALDKPSAIQFLKTKFPAEDEKSLSALYEVFKGGLYDGRNIALSSLGNTLRAVRQHEERGEYATAVELIRSTLENLKRDLGKNRLGAALETEPMSRKHPAFHRRLARTDEDPRGKGKTDMRASKIWATAFLTCVLLSGQSLAWNSTAGVQKSVARRPQNDLSARGLFIRKSADAVLVKVLDAKTDEPVSPSKAFTSDDELRVVIQSNFDGYAYIVNVEKINKTEKRYLLYPNPLAVNNRIKPDEPLKLNVAFDETAATEVLQVIVSHDRIEYLDAALNGSCSESENRCLLDARVAALVASIVGNRPPPRSSEIAGVFPRQSDRKQNQSGLRSRDIILAPGKDKDVTETYVAIPLKQGSDGRLKAKQAIVFEVRLKHV